jgi:hypothetical protein
MEGELFLRKRGLLPEVLIFENLVSMQHFKWFIPVDVSTQK